MEIELRFYATFRDAVGSKTIYRSFDPETNVGTILSSLESEYPELAGELLDEDDEIRPQLSVLKNGREVIHIEGTSTVLEDGDKLSIFPPVAGG